MWDLSNGPDLTGMFWQASYSNTVPLFDVSACTSFYFMFAESSFNNPNISSLNMSSAEIISYMFYGNTAFDQDLGAWNVQNVTDASEFLDGGTLSTANYNSLLVGWAAQTVQPAVTFVAGNSHYDGAGVAAHNTLTGTYGWSITDGGTP
jgi:hypothetical protein